MQLFFLRHGIAADRLSWIGRDADRPLTPEGRSRVIAVAKAIARLDLEIEVILTSSHLRARDTATILRDHCPNEPTFEVDPHLTPGFDFEKLKLLLKRQLDASRILFVGHEPDFSHTIAQITGGTSIVLKKAALARIDIDDREELRGKLVWLAPPKLLLRERTRDG